MTALSPTAVFAGRAPLDCHLPGEQDDEAMAVRAGGHDELSDTEGVGRHFAGDLAGGESSVILLTLSLHRY